MAALAIEVEALFPFDFSPGAKAPLSAAEFYPGKGFLILLWTPENRLQVISDSMTSTRNTYDYILFFTQISGIL